MFAAAAITRPSTYKGAEVVLGLRRRQTGSDLGGAATPIDADLAGAVISGQVAIGEHIVQIHAEHGAIVNYQPPDQRPVPRARSTPVRCLPRPFDQLLGRGELLDAAHRAVGGGGPAELVGEAGIGKTSLLRNLSHHLAELEPHGAIFTSARGQPAADVLQFIFECFYDCGGAVLVPTREELARNLADRRALIVIDDAELEREDLERVLNLVPGCTVLWASTERRLWGEGSSIQVPGLDDDTAIALLERELGRPVVPDLRSGLLHCCRLLGGSPLRILQVGGFLRTSPAGGERLLRAARELTGTTLDRLLAGQLSEGDRGVLSPLFALRNAPLGVGAVAAATGVGDAGERLRELLQRNLVEAHSPRYTLAGDPSPDLISTPGEDDGWLRVERVRSGLVAHFARGSEADDASVATEDAEPLLAVLRDAVRRDRPYDVMRLAHAGDRVLALSGRWGAWGLALDAALPAATTLGNGREQAWALHQLGSRALGYGDRAAAREQLGIALELRERLGDHAGAAVTRHNLDLLSGPAPPPPRPPRPRGPLIGALVAVFAAVGGIGAAAALSGGGTQSAPSVKATSKSVTNTPRKTTSTSTSTTTTSSKTNAGGAGNGPGSGQGSVPLAFAPNPVVFSQRGVQVSATNVSGTTIMLRSVTANLAGYVVNPATCGQATLSPQGSCFVYLYSRLRDQPAATLIFQLADGRTATDPIQAAPCTTTSCTQSTSTGPSSPSTSGTNGSGTSSTSSSTNSTST
jgi:NB-ARC domain